MANPIQNESAVYGGTPQAEPAPQTNGDGHPDWTSDDALLANELLIDDVDRQLAQSNPTVPTQGVTGSPSAEKPVAQKQAKKTTPDSASTPAATTETRKRKRSTKAKEATAPEPAKVPEVAAPTPAPAPPGVAEFDPHAQQRLDRVASNRAADQAEAQRKLDADAATRAKIHLLRDPGGQY